jgi:hypothetical protein
MAIDDCMKSTGRIKIQIVQLVDEVKKMSIDLDNASSTPLFKNPPNQF